MIDLPEGCTIYSTDFIITSVNSFSSKLPVTLWGYQLDPFINKSDLLILINFKIMSDFGLHNLTQMKPPITDVPIVIFMDTLKYIDNEYSNYSTLWLIIAIIICFILDASHLMSPLIHLKCANKYNQYFTQCGEKKPEAPTVEMIPMTSTATNPDIHSKMWQVLEKNGINPRAYEKYLIRKYGKTMSIL